MQLESLNFLKKISEPIRKKFLQSRKFSQDNIENLTFHYEKNDKLKENTKQALENEGFKHELEVLTTFSQNNNFIEILEELTDNVLTTEDDYSLNNLDALVNHAIKKPSLINQIEILNTHETGKMKTFCFSGIVFDPLDEKQIEQKLNRFKEFVIDIFKQNAKIDTKSLVCKPYFVKKGDIYFFLFKMEGKPKLQEELHHSTREFIYINRILAEDRTIMYDSTNHIIEVKSNGGRVKNENFVIQFAKNVFKKELKNLLSYSYNIQLLEDNLKRDLTLSLPIEEHKYKLLKKILIKNVCLQKPNGNCITFKINETSNVSSNSASLKEDISTFFSNGSGQKEDIRSYKLFSITCTAYYYINSESKKIDFTISRKAQSDIGTKEIELEMRRALTDLQIRIGRIIEEGNERRIA
jgi:hypothetical protein